MTALDEKNVATWMLSEYKKGNYLDQETVVYQIEEVFGDEYVYTNDNGNLAISKKVLKAFREITDDSVVWDRSERAWRRREEFDEPGRQQ